MIVKEFMPLKAGFTLLEIAIGLAILGVAGSMVLPSLNRQIMRYEQNKMLAELDGIIAEAFLHTLKSGKIHRVKANLSSGNIVVEKQKQEEQGEVYEKVSSHFFQKDFVLPSSYQIVNFYIDGLDECAQHGAGRTMQDVWFYIYPQGYSQSVVINIVNQQQSSSNGSEIGLVLNPFRLQFEVHDAFQQP